MATVTMAAMAATGSTPPVAISCPSVGLRFSACRVPQRGRVGVRGIGVAVASLHVGGRRAWKT